MVFDFSRLDGKWTHFFCWHVFCHINLVGQRYAQLKSSSMGFGMSSINNILIIASESMLVEMIMRHLKRRGLFLSKAENNKEAQEILIEGNTNGSQFDVVIADLFGTRIQGTKLFNWFKREFPCVPMLVLSGYGTIDMTMKILRPEMDSFCRKPFTPEDMMASLEEIDAKMKLQKHDEARQSKAV